MIEVSEEGHTVTTESTRQVPVESTTNSEEGSGSRDNESYVSSTNEPSTSFKEGADKGAEEHKDEKAVAIPGSALDLSGEAGRINKEESVIPMEITEVDTSGSNIGDTLDMKEASGEGIEVVADSPEQGEKFEETAPSADTTENEMAEEVTIEKDQISTENATTAVEATPCLPTNHLDDNYQAGGNVTESTTTVSQRNDHGTGDSVDDKELPSVNVDIDDTNQDQPVGEEGLAKETPNNNAADGNDHEDESDESGKQSLQSSVAESEQRRPTELDTHAHRELEQEAVVSMEVSEDASSEENDIVEMKRNESIQGMSVEGADDQRPADIDRKVLIHDQDDEERSVLDSVAKDASEISVEDGEGERDLINEEACKIGDDQQPSKSDSDVHIQMQHDEESTIKDVPADVSPTCIVTEVMENVQPKADIRSSEGQETAVEEMAGEMEVSGDEPPRLTAVLGIVEECMTTSDEPEILEPETVRASSDDFALPEQKIGMESTNQEFKTVSESSVEKTESLQSEHADIGGQPSEVQTESISRSPTADVPPSAIEVSKDNNEVHEVGSITQQPKTPEDSRSSELSTSAASGNLENESTAQENDVTPSATDLNKEKSCLPEAQNDLEVDEISTSATAESEQKDALAEEVPENEVKSEEKGKQEVTGTRADDIPEQPSGSEYVLQEVDIMEKVKTDGNLQEADEISSEGDGALMIDENVADEKVHESLNVADVQTNDADKTENVEKLQDKPVQMAVEQGQSRTDESVADEKVNESLNVADVQTREADKTENTEKLQDKAVQMAVEQGQSETDPEMQKTGQKPLEENLEAVKSVAVADEGQPKPSEQPSTNLQPLDESIVSDKTQKTNVPSEKVVSIANEQGQSRTDPETQETSQKQAEKNLDVITSILVTGDGQPKTSEQPSTNTQPDEETANIILQEILKMSETIGQGVLEVGTSEGGIRKENVAIVEESLAVREAKPEGSVIEIKDDTVQAAPTKQTEETTETNQGEVKVEEAADVQEVNGIESNDDSVEHHLQHQDNFDEAEVIAIQSESSQDSASQEVRKAKKRIYAKTCRTGNCSCQYCKEEKKAKIESPPPEDEPEENQVKKKPLPSKKFKRLAISFVPTQKKLKCSACILEFDTEESRKEHYDSTHVNQPVLCSYCKEAFPNDELALLHERAHVKQSLFLCLICDKTYKRKGDIVRHCKTHANANSPPTKSEAPTDDSTHTESKPPPEHSTPTKRKAPPVEESEEIQAKKKPVTTSQTKRLSVSFTGEKVPVKCPSCQLRFEGKLEMETHYKLVHTKVSLICSICQAPFMDKDSLKQHEARHGSDGCFSCLKCDKVCKRKQDIINHYRKHKDQKPTSAGVTNEKSAEASSSGASRSQTPVKQGPSRSKKAGTTTTKEGLFACSLCGKEFIQEELLEVHKRIHTGMI